MILIQKKLHNLLLKIFQQKEKMLKMFYKADNISVCKFSNWWSRRELKLLIYKGFVSIIILNVTTDVTKN